MGTDETLALTVGIVAAYVSRNSLPPVELPGLIAAVRAALVGLGEPVPTAEPAASKLMPAQIRRSIPHEALVSFEDGKPYKTPRRHLTLRGLTPEAYRAKWGLPADYPMTAQVYSEQRSALARSFGLGRKHVDAPEPEAASAEATAPKRRGRDKQPVA